MSSSSKGEDSSSSSSSSEPPLPGPSTACKIWLGNLGPRSSEAAVLALSKPFGAIQKLDFVYGLGGGDGQQRVPKGFAFVTYREPSAARRAVQALDGQFVSSFGRTLKANIANPSRRELREMMGAEAIGKRKKTLEEARREDEEREKRRRELAPSKSDLIRALEAKLGDMDQKEAKFKLAVPKDKS